MSFHYLEELAASCCKYQWKSVECLRENIHVIEVRPVSQIHEL